MHNRHLQATWTRLYSTEIDGMSFNRVEHHILGYDGPTCILIKVRDSAGTVLGAFAMERWKEQNRFYGAFGSIVIQSAIFAAPEDKDVSVQRVEQRTLPV
eukprot:gene44097-55607_t